MSTVPHSPPAAGPSRTVRAIARATSPISLMLAGRRFFPLWAVLHHIGRRSGRAYSIPVAVRASADTFTIALPWGEGTHWVQNVLAPGRCTIRWRGVEEPVTEPSVIGPAEAAPAFSPLQRALLRATGIRAFLLLRRTRPGARSSDPA